MKKIDLKSNDYLDGGSVVIANVVTRAAQSLSLSEKRILFAGIAKMAGVNASVKLSALEYTELYGVSLNTAYDQLKAAAENIFHRYLTFQISDGKKLGITRTRWISAYDYFDKEGYVSFYFSQRIYPYLFNLKREFTRYKLDQACALRSVHSWRLLELIEQYRQNDGTIKRKHGWIQLSIEDFWHAMEAKKSYRSNFAMLRHWVIEPAVNELLQKDNWLITWEPLKKGRKVIALRFSFSRDPQTKLDF